MTTLPEVERELENRRTSKSSCPLAQVEKCGLTNIGVSALCHNCPTAHHFIEEFIYQYTSGIHHSVLPPILQEEIDRLINNLKISVGNTIDDEYVSNLISLFCEKVTDHIEKTHGPLDKIPTEELLFLHTLQILKKRIETFRKTQNPDIDQGIRAIVKDLIQTITGDIIVAY